MDERGLKKKAKEYWSKIDRESITDRLEWYARNLLLDEMCWADDNQTDDGKPRISKLSEPCDLLVMLVGLSVEPLLQTIYTYKPKRVLLLYNKNYGDPDDDYSISGERLTRTIKNLIPAVTSSIKAGSIECHPLETADTVSIFRTLLNKIGEASGNVIIDITGGKKNMIAGAFLYAAYANIKVSYVDFDDEAYDAHRGRPYGHRCRIGLIENPYQTFALRDWERVRALYNRYNFRAARALLVGLDEEREETILSAAGVYLPEQVEPIQKMAKLLQCYEAWDNAEFDKAKGFACEIAWNNEFPRAIEVLGDWRRSFANTEELRIYVYNELNRIEKLFDNGNYRATFLRAGNLNEILMVARLVEQFSGNDRDELLVDLNDPDKGTPGAKDIFNALCKYQGRARIQIVPSRTRRADRNTSYISFRGTSLCIQTGLFQEMNSWWNRTVYYKDDATDCKDDGTKKCGWEKFLNTRNSIAHTYKTVDRNQTRDALLFVQANFEDFLGSVSMDDYGPAEILPWSELCKRCGLTPHLPINLRKDQ